MSEEKYKSIFEKLSDKLFASSILPPWVIVIMRYLLLFSFGLLAVSLILYMVRIPERTIVLFGLTIINLFVYMFVFAMLFLSTVIWYALSFFGVTSAMRSFEEKQVADSIAQGKCVLPSTWIAFIMFTIFCALMLLLAIVDFFEHPTISLSGIWTFIFYAIGAVYLVSLSPPVKKFDKYMDGITEDGGEVCYQGNPMSKWEKKFFRLARTLFIYIYLFTKGFKEGTPSDGQLSYKGRAISDFEVKVFRIIGSSLGYLLLLMLLFIVVWIVVTIFRAVIG
ncbi:MAG: hypothetical protein R3D71_03205 [Rickettsiales bacterium]